MDAVASRLQIGIRLLMSKQAVEAPRRGDLSMAPIGQMARSTDAIERSPLTPVFFGDFRRHRAVHWPEDYVWGRWPMRLIESTVLAAVGWLAGWFE